MVYSRDAMRSETGTRLLTVPCSDLYRSPLPAAHPPRLPAHLLRRLPEGVVRFPSLDRYLETPVYMSIMSRLRTHHAAQCHRYYTT